MSEELNTSVTVVYLCCIIWYKYGYCSLKGNVSSHWSSQNLIWAPFLIENAPNYKKSLFTFISPTKKCESLGFQNVCDSGLDLKVHLAPMWVLDQWWQTIRSLTFYWAFYREITCLTLNRKKKRRCRHEKWSFILYLSHRHVVQSRWTHWKVLWRCEMKKHFQS
jgi:hypothetical protein